ncbi:hypothetical protein TNCV_3632041 [Trichonephila clavipes]|nr:hypothetical protein TNCV_3632041 [Trichonephila clavipes]
MQENQGPDQWLLAHCKKPSNRLDFSSGLLRYGSERSQLVYLQFSLELIASDRQEGLLVYSRVLIILDGRRPCQNIICWVKSTNGKVKRHYLAEGIVSLSLWLLQQSLKWREQTRILEYRMIELKRVYGRLRDAPSRRNGSKNLHKSASETFDIIRYD